jgi:hypothetical protein
MLTSAEEKILKKIAEQNLITKIELKRFLLQNSQDSKEIGTLVETVARNLMEKNLIAAINPVGSTCFVITQRGSKLLKDLE